MKIHFFKTNGAGNDFIVIANMDDSVRVKPGQIRWLCDRRRGVGADGVIVLESEPGFDFRMRYYNADGGEAEMCGNGARCAALLAKRLDLGRVDGERTRLRFKAHPGPFDADVRSNRVSIAMTPAVGFEQAISLEVAGRREIVHFINTGVPHAVILEEAAARLEEREVVNRGRAVRGHPRFAPGGANANFVAVAPSGEVHIRTYERGVEAETLACGTGSVAAAVVLAHIGKISSPVRLLTRGGDKMSVAFELDSSGAHSVFLEGPAEINFEGTADLPAER